MDKNNKKRNIWCERIILTLTTFLFLSGSFLVTPFIINLIYEGGYWLRYDWVVFFLVGVILYTVSDSCKKHRVYLITSIVLFALFILIRNTYQLGAIITVAIAGIFGAIWLMVEVGLVIKRFLIRKQT